MKDLESNLEKILQPDYASVVAGTQGSTSSGASNNNSQTINYSSEEPTLVGITPMEMSTESVQSVRLGGGGTDEYTNSANSTANPVTEQILVQVILIQYFSHIFIRKPINCTY